MNNAISGTLIAMFPLMICWSLLRFRKHSYAAGLTILVLAVNTLRLAVRWFAVKGDIPDWLDKVTMYRPLILGLYWLMLLAVTFAVLMDWRYQNERRQDTVDLHPHRYHFDPDWPSDQDRLDDK